MRAAVDAGRDLRHLWYALEIGAEASLKSILVNLGGGLRRYLKSLRSDRCSGLDVLTTLHVQWDSRILP
jgi:hypothetical protein